jgi:hypothetical protein
MHHRSYAIRIDADTCRRLVRLQRGTGTPVQKLINALVRNYLDLRVRGGCRRSR